MGDCVLASGMLDDLRHYYPEACFHLNVLSPWHKLFEHDSRIDEIVNFPIRKAGIKAMIRWLLLIKAQAYDLVIDFQGNDRTAILLSLCKVLGFKKGLFLGRTPKFCYDLSAKDTDKSRHVFEHLQEMLKMLGINPQSRQPRLIPGAVHINKVHQLKESLALTSKKYALFIPGSSPQGQAKQWPKHYFNELAQKLLDSSVDHIVLIGSKNETTLCAEIAATDPRIINLCNQTELLEIALWCESATIIIGNDTGASHIAASTLVPQIALFGPTSAERSRPYGPGVTVLEAIKSPVLITPPQSSMINLTPEYVWTICQNIILGERQ